MLRRALQVLSKLLISQSSAAITQGYLFLRFYQFTGLITAIAPAEITVERIRPRQGCSGEDRSLAT